MEEQKRAKLRAMHILTRMDRTEQELENSLCKTGYSAEAVSGAMDYVRSYGYLDDRKYTRKYLECYRDRKSLQRMKFDLAKKGVSKDIISEILEEIEPADEKALIRSLLKKKWPGEEKPNEKELNRLFGFLARKGFKSSDIWSVLREENLT
ncbi:MAG: regulatory protein RecX [Lachnospiraceae bacterium]|nr:regulatory protein RecX [Lachnospiraceae bacterium]